MHIGNPQHSILVMFLEIIIKQELPYRYYIEINSSEFAMLVFLKF